MLGHTENSSLMTRRKSSSSNQQEEGSVAVRRNGIDKWTDLRIEHFDLQLVLKDICCLGFSLLTTC